MQQNKNLPKPRYHLVKRFYFLDYFYVLLKSAENSSRPERIFEQFLTLKHKHRLGESRYKKQADEASVSTHRIVRYRYTFEQVVSESEEYNLLKQYDGNIYLTEQGQELVQIYEAKGTVAAYWYLLQFIESRYHAFRYIIDDCYKHNPGRSGLLIFPIYSANQLGIKRSSLVTSSDLRNYLLQLNDRLQQDIHNYLGKRVNLSSKNDELIESLMEAEMLPRMSSEPFNSSRYNAILKRTRDHWLKYFLQDLYGFSMSLSTFDIWAYRGKQIGILHITEFYPDPNFNGRIVYPLSVVKASSSSENFKNLYTYSDDKQLLVHLPSWKREQTQEEFVQALHHAYLDVRQFARTYFVSLLNVRERVCYTMRIPEYLFDEFLGRAYHERLKVRISLEVDKLPDETQAMYLQREPVMVDGKFRNIIAIDLA